MSMETITIYEEGTGVHICIPNISVAEVKKIMAGAFISSITSGNDVKFEKIEADELKIDNNAAINDEPVKQETADQEENAAEATDRPEINSNAATKEIPAETVKNSEEIPESENVEDKTITLSSPDTPAESELPFPEMDEQKNNAEPELNSKAVINSAPEFEDIPYDDDETEDTSETSDNVSNDTTEAAEPAENPTAPVTSNNSELVFKVLESKLSKPGIDKILSGFAAVVFMRVKPEISIRCNDTIVVNISGLDDSDIAYIKQVARATRNFEEEN